MLISLKSLKDFEFFVRILGEEKISASLNRQGVYHISVLGHMEIQDHTLN